MRYEVRTTDFHGGRHISNHRIPERAIARAIKERIADCICGCAYAVEIDKDGNERNIYGYRFGGDWVAVYADTHERIAS